MGSAVEDQHTMRFRAPSNHRLSVPGAMAAFLNVDALRFGMDGGVDGPSSIVMDGWTLYFP